MILLMVGCSGKKELFFTKNRTLETEKSLIILKDNNNNIKELSVNKLFIESEELLHSEILDIIDDNSKEIKNTKIMYHIGEDISKELDDSQLRNLEIKTKAEDIIENSIAKTVLIEALVKENNYLRKDTNNKSEDGLYVKDIINMILLSVVILLQILICYALFSRKKKDKNNTDNMKFFIEKSYENIENIKKALNKFLEKFDNKEGILPKPRDAI